MEEAILSLPEQLAWTPALVNREQLKKTDKFIVCGLGGSHLAAGLLKVANPFLDLLIHRDYGLPRVPDYFLTESLIICSSYSGQTVEVIDAFQTAQKRGLKTAVIADQGELLDLAKESGVPYLDLPATDFQPRMAIGYSLRALNLFIGGEPINPQIKPEIWRTPGEKLAEKLVGQIPLIYSSTVNWPLAYVWKVLFNETAKAPAFANALPELCHNEIESVSSRFHPVFLQDELDDGRIVKRMQVLEQLFRARGVASEIIKLTGANQWEKIFNAIILADWTALTLARQNQVDSETVSLIEELKRKI